MANAVEPKQNGRSRVPKANPIAAQQIASAVALLFLDDIMA